MTCSRLGESLSADMTLFDWFIIIVIVLSTIMAAAQGLVLEVVSLAALVLGLWLAFWNYGVLAAPLSRVIHSVGVADVLAFLIDCPGRNADYRPDWEGPPKWHAPPD